MKVNSKKKMIVSVMKILLLVLVAVFIFVGDAVVQAELKQVLPNQITTVDKEQKGRSVNVGGEGTLNLRGTPLTSGSVPIIDAWNIHGCALAEHQSYIRMQGSDGSGPFSVYCLDYGKSANSGTIMTGRGMDALDAGKKKQLSECLSFGYVEQTSSPSVEQKAKYAATQAMVWNIMAGLYPSEKGDQSAEQYLAYVESPDLAVQFYTTLKYNMQTYEQIPAFTSGTKEKSPEYILEWNEKNARFETTIEDKYMLAGKSTFQFPGGIQMETKGSKVTIYTKQYLDQAPIIEGTRTDLILKNAVMYWNDRQDTQRFGVCDLQTSIGQQPFYFKVRMQKAQIDVSKIDAETGKKDPQGMAKEFAGTIYDLFNQSYKEGDTKESASYVSSMTLDKEGKASIKELDQTKYILKERQAPEGYLVDKTAHEINFPSEDKSSPVHASIVSKEAVIRGDIELMKFGQDKPGEETEMKHPLEGITFTLTSLTTKEQYKIKTDKSGYASTKQLGNERGGLPYDRYRIEETKGKEGYKIIDPFEVTIKEEGQVLRYIIEDKNVCAAICIQKEDAETGKIIPAAGTEFRIRNEKGKAVVMYTYYPKKTEHKTFLTDETGTLTLPEPLPYGTYTLEEVKAPSGYLKAGPISFKVAKTMDYEKPLTIICQDDHAKGKIQIKKVDQDTKKPLEGVMFEIRAKEEIKTPDGTVRAAKNEVLETLITDKEGKALSKELYFGTYTVKEIKCQEGYQLKETEDEVVLSYKDQDTPVVTYQLTVENKKTVPNILQEEQISTTPKTGDKTDVCVLTLFLILSCFLIRQCAKISHRDY